VSTGCGGGKGASTAQPAIQFTNPTTGASLDPGQSISLSISVAGSSPVTWSLQTGFGKPVGSLSNQTATGATYTAPLSVTAEAQVTVVATAGSNSAALPVFVEPPPQITGTSSPTATKCPAAGSVILPFSPGTLVVGQTLSSASLNALSSGGVAPYTWTVASGSLPNGLSIALGTNTSAAPIVGTLVTPGCSTFSLQVTDATGVSATSQSLSLVVIPAALTTSFPNIPIAYVDSSNNGVPYPPGQLIGSGGVMPYKWSLAAGAGGQSNLPPGLSLTSTGLLSGVPSSTGLIVNGGFGAYSAPLLLTDSQLPYPATAQVTLGMTVASLDSSCGTGSENNLTTMGPYAFFLRGFDANGAVTIAGNFTVDGAGSITGGAEDISRTTGSQTSLSILPGSTYSLGANNRGCFTLTNSAGTTTTFRVAFGGCSNGRNSQGSGCQPPAGGGNFYYTIGHIVEFDDSTGTGTRLSGIVRLQDSSTFQNSGLSGLYAFGLSGWDAAGGRFAMAGSANASSGAFSAVAADANDAGTLATALTGGSGTFSIGPGGRGTGTMTVGSLSLSLVLYPVSSREAIVVTVGPPTASNPLLSGEAIGTTGPFSALSLQNSHMFHIAGLSTVGPDPNVGVLSFDGVATVTGTQYENEAGTLGTSSISATYTVDANTARFVFAALSINQNLGSHPLVGYVIPAPSNLSSASCNTPAACVTGFLVSTDASAQAGELEFQTPSIAPPPPFTVESIVGDYVFGTDEVLDSHSANFEGLVIASPVSSNLNSNQDASYGDPTFCLDPSCVLLIPNDQVAGKYSVKTNGTGSFGGQTISVTNGADTFFISQSPLDTHPAVVVVEE
jgi:hypothetical protein